jgi:hypothetical protein
MPGMSQQNESPTTKPGNDCPLCRKGTLVPSPSGINLLCRACKKITVLPLAQRPDGQPVAARRGGIPGRHKKRF